MWLLGSHMGPQIQDEPRGLREGRGAGIPALVSLDPPPLPPLVSAEDWTLRRTSRSLIDVFIFHLPLKPRQYPNSEAIH